MRIFKTIILLAAIMFFYGCSSAEGDECLAAFGGNSVELAPSDSIDLETFGIIPERVAEKDGRYYITPAQGKEHLIILDPVKKTKTSMVRRGRGPQEMVFSSSFQLFDGKIMLFDSNGQVYVAVSEEGIDTVAVFNPDVKLNRPSVLTSFNGGIAGVGTFDECMWYGIVNGDGGLSSGVEKITLDEYRNLSDFELISFQINSCISISPDGTKCVCATLGAGIISFSRIEKGKIEEVKRLQYYGPELAPVRDESLPVLAYSPESRRAFYDAAATDDKAYLLYSGLPLRGESPSFLCSHLLVYDWSGKPLKHYVLKAPISSLSINGETVTGVSMYPESRIYTYKLKN